MKSICSERRSRDFKIHVLMVFIALSVYGSVIGIEIRFKKENKIKHVLP